MIANWDDGDNAIFTAGPESEEAQTFKKSKRGRWISRSPRFKDTFISDADENLVRALLSELYLELC